MKLRKICRVPAVKEFLKSINIWRIGEDMDKSFVAYFLTHGAALYKYRQQSCIGISGAAA